MKVPELLLVIVLGIKVPELKEGSFSCRSNAIVASIIAVADTCSEALITGLKKFIVVGNWHYHKWTKVPELMLVIVLGKVPTYIVWKQ